MDENVEDQMVNRIHRTGNQKEKIVLTVNLKTMPIDKDSFSLLTEMNNPLLNSLNQVSREIFELREKAIQEGLIKLGWTPPKTYIPRLSARKDLYILRNYIHNWLRKSKTHKEERLAAIAALEDLEKFVKGKYDATD
jgi:hypothetical protein